VEFRKTKGIVSKVEKIILPITLMTTELFEKRSQLFLLKATEAVSSFNHSVSPYMIRGLLF